MPEDLNVKHVHRIEFIELIDESDSLNVIAKLLDIIHLVENSDDA